MKHGSMILHCCQFAAPYEGNFLRSLSALETHLQELGCQMAYVFPIAAKSQPWWPTFSVVHRVYTTTDNVQHSDDEIAKILSIVKPAIVHTHFDGYDMPVVKAVEQCRYDIKVIWHLRDMLAYHPNMLKHLYQHFCFFRHYGYYARKVSVIAVSDEILAFVSRYRTLLGGDFCKKQVVMNGLDCTRIEQRVSYELHNPVTLLSYGGRNIQKRIDLLLSAVNQLLPQYRINVLITNGVDTEETIRSYFKGSIPEWCQLIPQNDNVNEILNQSDCFVSASVHETFSNAICEATIFGLPVIQSDIKGTSWNAENPSSFMFQSGNPNDLARAIRDFLECDKAKLAKSILETRETNLRKFAIAGWCRQIADFYDSL